MDGILLVDKPRGWTSFDVVAKVRSTIRQSLSHQVTQSNSQALGDYGTNGLSTKAPKVRVGHTGTLDPLATGLLVLLVGKATKQAPELSKLDKTYEATIQLGATSTTGDAEGEITPTKLHSNGRSSVSVTEVEKVLLGFVGEIEQIPPAYSAIKVDGQRAYKLARQGKEVKIEPRNVKVYSLQLTGYSYPELKITVHVSSGTYIRTLAEDIGKTLGTGAYLTNLNRTKVGQFDLKDAVNIENISAEEIYRHLK